MPASTSSVAMWIRTFLPDRVRPRDVAAQGVRPSRPDPILPPGLHHARYVNIRKMRSGLSIPLTPNEGPLGEGRGGLHKSRAFGAANPSKPAVARPFRDAAYV